MLDTDEQARKMNGGFQFAVFSCAEKRQAEFPHHSRLLSDGKVFVHKLVPSFNSSIVLIFWFFNKYNTFAGICKMYN